MNNPVALDTPIPEKFPIGEFAVIICKRCKKRYQLSFIVTHGGAVEHHTCPRCHSFITVVSTDGAGLVTRGQASTIGTFTLSLNLKRPIHQPSI